jgi:hypothetical protein
MLHALPFTTFGEAAALGLKSHVYCPSCYRTCPVDPTPSRDAASVLVYIAIAEPIHQSLQGRSLDALSCIDAFDLCDLAFALTRSVNCVDAESAIADAPRYDLLSH